MHKNYAIAQFLATFAHCKKKHVMEAFQWLQDLFTKTDSVAHIALLYAVVIAAGVYLGKIKIGGISLGVTLSLSPTAMTNSPSACGLWQGRRFTAGCSSSAKKRR